MRFEKPSFLLLLILLMAMIFHARAQQEVERRQYDDAHFWTSINSTHRLSQRWGLVADLHIRRENFIQDPNFYFARIGGAYWINDEFSLVAGVAGLWRATDTEAGLAFGLEKRSYQQILWRSNNGKITFLQRIRIEQRWQEVLDRENGTVERLRFSSRFRFLMSARVRAFKNEKMPAPVISNEILFHAGKEIVYNTFDQNRLFLGFNQKLGKNLSVDYGYMMVYQQRYSGFEYNMNHTFRLFFYYAPDFRKKAKEGLPHYPVDGIE